MNTLTVMNQENIGEIVMTTNSFTKEQMALYGSAIKQARKEKRDRLASLSIPQASALVTASLPEGTVLRDVRERETARGKTWTVKFYKSFDNTKAALEAKLRREEAKLESIREQLSKLSATKV